MLLTLRIMHLFILRIQHIYCDSFSHQYFESVITIFFAQMYKAGYKYVFPLKNDVTSPRILTIF